MSDTFRFGRQGISLSCCGKPQGCTRIDGCVWAETKKRGTRLHAWYLKDGVWWCGNCPATGATASPYCSMVGGRR